MRTADNESACRIDVNGSVGVHQLGGDNCLDDLLDEVGAYLLERNVFVVLCGNYHRVDAYRLAVLVVLNGHLSFAVGTQIAQLAALANVGKLLGQLVRQRDGERHKLWRFIAGVAEHHALVARADVADVFFSALERIVNAHRDVGRLLVDGGEYCAGVAVEAVSVVVVAYIADDFAHDGRDIHLRLSRDLAHAHYHTCGGKRFAGNARLRILLEHSIEYSVRNVVANFVGVTFRHRFRCKKNFRHWRNSFSCRGNIVQLACATPP